MQVRQVMRVIPVLLAVGALSAWAAQNDAGGTTNVSGVHKDKRPQTRNVHAKPNGPRGAAAARKIDGANAAGAHTLAEPNANIRATDGGITKPNASIRAIDGGAITASDAKPNANTRAMDGGITKPNASIRATDGGVTADGGAVSALDARPNVTNRATDGGITVKDAKPKGPQGAASSENTAAGVGK